MFKAQNGPLSNLRDFVQIAFPLLFFLSFESLVPFYEKILLSYHSVDAVHACLNADYIDRLFRSSCAVFATMAQVYVGFYKGSNEPQKIGPCVWQFIWFSLFSTFIVIPCGLFVSDFYFQDVAFASLAKEYLFILLIGNCLLPLNLSLTSFYLGRGKTRFITLTLLSQHIIHLFVSRVLILGIPGYLPAMGMSGAALAQCAVLLLSDLVLFCGFLKRHNRQEFATNEWKCVPKKMASYGIGGLTRIFHYVSSAGTWIAISYAFKTAERAIDVITVGGVIISFINFIPHGIQRTLLTLASNFFGGKQINKLRELLMTNLLVVFLTSLILAIPFLFPNLLLFLFDSTTKDLFNNLLPTIGFSIWFYLVCLTIQLSSSGFIIAGQKLKVQIYISISYWIEPFLIYLIFHYFQFSSTIFWFIMGISNLVTFAIFAIVIRPLLQPYPEKIPT